ncbi:MULTISPECIES: aldo/keto reductase [Halococcus]|uniref:Aldo/keto reductase n=1 Tax=Halococcus salifodinae DSM 8989 TaxID=1227456 RepID=M0N9I2_9EURY|nr:MULTISPECIES: aldo/keto reductase [Halococcus]EMA53315.1 aldo/keto reductase [Halococcus salifodinae DSM 8989]
MKCSLVGAGSVAGEYLAGIDDTSLSLAAVCDHDRDRAAAVADAHDATAYGDVATLLDREPSPLIVNLTSHAAHASVTRAALDAGRHVFSEKPLATDAAVAADLVALAERRGLGLACAPINHRCGAQRRAATMLADGRTGPVRMASAHAHVGRVTDWHDRPQSFFDVGPLYDGAVYPLSLLVAWFGPVERVRSADAAAPWPDRSEAEPQKPTHVEATLSFAAGPLVRLTASLYVPHRSREFYGLELHGDDGSVYLRDAGALVDGDEGVAFGRVGRGYTAVPPQSPAADRSHIDGPARLAAAIREGCTPRESARRGAHVVAACNAIEDVAGGAGAGRTVIEPSAEAVTGTAAGAVVGTPADRDETIEVDGGGRAARRDDPAGGPDFGAATTRRRAPVVRPDRARTDAAIRLPSIGFGCSRYRGDEYVDRRESIATALDAGYRLLDSAELYGNEARIGDLLAAPGAPDRSSLHVTSKVWNTNHGHVAEACETTLDALGLDALDSYLLHWPEAWAYQGPLENLADRSIEAQEKATFPRDADGEIETVAVTLEEAWRSLERLVDRGLTRTIGICNVSMEQLESVCSLARVPPALVQIEHHPHTPREDLVAFCHRRGIRVVAHSPLPASVLTEPVVEEIADERGLSPAQVVLAWNVGDGVVPIPSSTEPAHIVENAAAAAVRLSQAEYDRLDALSGDGSGDELAGDER